MVYGDIFTNGYFNLISNLINNDTYAAKLKSQNGELTLNDVLTLTTGLPPDNGKYVVLNYGLEPVLIGYDWDAIKPWGEFDNHLSSNPFYNELYESSSISILKSDNIW